MAADIAVLKADSTRQYKYDASSHYLIISRNLSRFQDDRNYNLCHNSEVKPTVPVSLNFPKG